MHVILLILKLGIIASIDAFTTLSQRQSCAVNINTDLGTPQPLYLYYQSPDLVRTSNRRSYFYLEADQKIDIFCSDGFKPPFAGGNRTKVLTASCISGNRFELNGRSESLRNVRCTRNLYSDTKPTNRTCVAGHTVEIGFNVENAWIPLMEICHDDEIASTLWTRHRLTPQSQSFQRSVVRVKFVKGKFYRGIRPDIAYTRNEQRKTIAKILGSNKIADDIVSRDSDLFLARGHLAAKSDFIFGAHQLATFFFINAAPQWQTFNDGNWLQIEIGVKRFVEKRNINVDVYTGTYDVMVYPDVDNREQEIFLAWNEKTGKRQLPVPRFYYKVLIADEIQAGIVFIGVNNPYLPINLIKSKYILCPDVGDQVHYVDWQRKNITIGYSYACSINEFTKVVKHLPHIPKYNKLLI